jgi:hypothetical protein
VVTSCWLYPCPYRVLKKLWNMSEIYEIYLKLMKNYLLFKVYFTKLFTCFWNLWNIFYCLFVALIVFQFCQKGNTSPISKDNVRWMTFWHIPLPVKRSFQIPSRLLSYLFIYFDWFNHLHRVAGRRPGGWGDLMPGRSAHAPNKKGKHCSSTEEALVRHSATARLRLPHATAT